MATALWASEIRPGLPPVARPASEFFDAASYRADDWLLYHLAVGAEMGEQLFVRGERLIINHHNVTPPHYFDSWMPAMAENLEVGEAQVVKLATRAHLGIGDSKFNADALIDAGCANTVVAPVFVDVERLGPPRELRDVQRARRTKTKWLFVGRVAPNKAIHDVITAFAWYRMGCDPAATLTIVGGMPADRYADAIRRLVARLDLLDAVEFAGSVSDHELGDFYRSADVYTSCSEHEGFGVPIIEAMYMGVPVVALDAAAIGETSAGAALLVDRADPALFAAAAFRACAHEPLRSELLARGRRRADDLGVAAVRARWREVLSALVGN